MTYTEFRKDNDCLPSIVRFEEMVNIKKDLCNLFWVDYSEEKMGELYIIPSDNPLLGMLGYTLYREESGKEISANLQMSFSKKAVEIAYNDRGMFNDAFSKSWDSEKPLCIYDDPVRMLCGFIVDSRDRREWHYIRLSDYKG